MHMNLGGVRDLSILSLQTAYFGIPTLGEVCLRLGLDGFVVGQFVPFSFFSTHFMARLSDLSYARTSSNKVLLIFITGDFDMVISKSQHPIFQSCVSISNDISIKPWASLRHLAIISALIDTIAFLCGNQYCDRYRESVKATRRYGVQGLQSITVFTADIPPTGLLIGQEKMLPILVPKLVYKRSGYVY